MISSDKARSLRSAGLMWHPAFGDSFLIEQPGCEHDVFTISSMAIEPHEFDTGVILGFNGTTEWALDSLALEDALWLPREDQLRDLLGEGFTALERCPESYRVTVDRGGVHGHFEAAEPADAYAAAVLVVLGGSFGPRLS